MRVTLMPSLTPLLVFRALAADIARRDTSRSSTPTRTSRSSAGVREYTSRSRSRRGSRVILPRRLRAARRVSRSPRGGSAPAPPVCRPPRGGLSSFTEVEPPAAGWWLSSKLRGAQAAGRRGVEPNPLPMGFAIRTRRPRRKPIHDSPAISATSTASAASAARPATGASGPNRSASVAVGATAGNPAGIIARSPPAGAPRMDRASRHEAVRWPTNAARTGPFRPPPAAAVAGRLQRCLAHVAAGTLSCLLRLAPPAYYGGHCLVILPLAGSEDSVAPGLRIRVDDDQHPEPVPGERLNDGVRTPSGGPVRRAGDRVGHHHAANVVVRAHAPPGEP